MNNSSCVYLFDDQGKFRPLANLEAEIIVWALMIAKGSRSEAARLLGIGRSTLYRRISELGLHYETEEDAA